MVGLILAMLLVYADVYREGTGRADREEEEIKTLRILSSYELKGQKEMLRALADEYESSHAGISFEIHWIDKEDLKKEVCLGVDGKQQPDLVICSSMEMPALVNMEVLEDLTEDIRSMGMERLIHPDQWKSVMGSGRFYGIPFTLDPYVLFCNRSYFEKKQLAYPQSWEEVLAALSGMEENGLYCFGFGIRSSGDAAAFFDNLLYTCGGNFYSLNGAPGLQAMELLDTLKRRGYVNKNVINYTAKDAAKDFAMEKTMMMIAPLSTGRCIEEYEKAPEFQILAAPSNIRQGYLLMGDNIGILKGGREEAHDFVQFLYTEGARKKILDDTGTLPLLEGEQEKFAWDRAADGLNSSFLQYGAPLDGYYSWFEMSSILSDCVYQVLTKKNIDLENITYHLQDEIRGAIMRY